MPAPRLHLSHPNSLLACPLTLQPCSEDPSLERCFKGHRDAATCVAWNAGVRQVVTGGGDGSVMVWHLAPRLRAFRFMGHQEAVLGLAYDPVNNLVASGSKDRTVRLWRPSAEGRSTVLKAHAGAVRSVAFSASGALLATASDDKSIKLWSAPQQRFLASLNGHTNWVRSVALAPDGRAAASGGDDRTARVWDLEARAAAHVFEEGEGGGGINVVRFHPDGEASYIDMRLAARALMGGGAPSLLACPFIF